MVIEYDSERSVYVDSETGDYMAWRQVDRDYNFFSFALHEKDGKGKIGIETQQFITKFHKGMDREDGKSAARLECFIVAAWTPDNSKPQNRNYIPKDHPMIDEITRFLIARNDVSKRPGDNYDFKITVDYKSSARELKEKYSHG
jgi:hypothetical protein